MDGICNVVGIVRSYSRHGNTTIPCAVDMVLSAHFQNLFVTEATVGKHSDLVCNVAPVPDRSCVFQGVPEGSSHSVNAISHSLALFTEFSSELRIFQDCGYKSGSMSRGIGVHGANHSLHLRYNPLGFVGISSDNGESTNTLTVQPKVLGETLNHRNQMAIFHKHSNGSGILGGISRSKALVGTIKEGNKVLILDDTAELLPLLKSWIHTCWIVGTGMKKDDTSGWHRFDVLDHPFKIQGRVIRIIIAVVLHFEPRVCEDVLVVSPTRIWKVQGCAAVLPHHLSKNT
mmetsp:Transcript_20482/g.50232  ORF Transcript_20482/g.50232 Transcript_20482/m.50232 type:complete len:287 (+) Transcript_20482:99-959(+)